MPDDLHTLAEIIEDVAALNTTASGKETADDAGDVTTDIEVLWVVDTDTLYTQAESSDARKDDRLSLTQFLLESIL